MSDANTPIKGTHVIRKGLQHLI